MAGFYGLAAFAALALALALPLLARAFLYQPFNVPAGSMIPTLLVGDYFFAAKYAYAPVFGGEPARGDVVVFSSPKDNTVFVKRVVGLPGDRIQVKDGELYINDAGHARALRGFCRRRPMRGQPGRDQTLARDVAERGQL